MLDTQRQITVPKVSGSEHLMYTDDLICSNPLQKQRLQKKFTWTVTSMKHLPQP